MDTELIRLFDEQAMEVYENGKRVLGYNATRFLQKIRADGGVSAAKSWLKEKPTDSPTKGFLKLVDHGRLDISLEALVLRDPWNTLFTESELRVAHQRLERYGYFLPVSEPALRLEPVAEIIENDAYVEGAVNKVLVNRYERDKDAREKCIEYYGPNCYICKFSFAIAYGDAFKDMIHVHHLVPIATIGVEYRIDPVAGWSTRFQLIDEAVQLPIKAL